MWAVRMETYLEALDLWEDVEKDYEIKSLPENPTNHKRRRIKNNQRQKHAYLQEYLPPYSHALCLSNQPKPYGTTISKQGMKVMTELRVCKC